MAQGWYADPYRQSGWRNVIRMPEERVTAAKPKRSVAAGLRYEQAAGNVRAAAQERASRSFLHGAGLPASLPEAGQAAGLALGTAFGLPEAWDAQAGNLGALAQAATNPVGTAKEELGAALRNPDAIPYAAGAAVPMLLPPLRFRTGMPVPAFARRWAEMARAASSEGRFMEMARNRMTPREAARTLLPGRLQRAGNVIGASSPEIQSMLTREAAHTPTIFVGSGWHTTPPWMSPSPTVVGTWLGPDEISTMSMGEYRPAWAMQGRKIPGERGSGVIALRDYPGVNPWGVLAHETMHAQRGSLGRVFDRSMPYPIRPYELSARRAEGRIGGGLLPFLDPQVATTKLGMTPTRFYSESNRAYPMTTGGESGQMSLFGPEPHAAPVQPQMPDVALPHPFLRGAQGVERKALERIGEAIKVHAASGQRQHAGTSFVRKLSAPGGDAFEAAMEAGRQHFARVDALVEAGLRGDQNALRALEQLGVPDAAAGATITLNTPHELVPGHPASLIFVPGRGWVKPY